MTVFEVAGITITKDLIFGWVVKWSTNVDGEYVMLKELTDKSLEYLAAQFYPVYVPESFKEEVLSVINLRKEEKRKDEVVPVVKAQTTSKKPSEVSFDYTPYNDLGRIHTYLLDRPDDAAKLLSEILKKSVVKPIAQRLTDAGEYMSTANLGYCIVSFDAKSEVPYRIIANDGKYYDCDNLSHVVETILRKWW